MEVEVNLVSPFYSYIFILYTLCKELLKILTSFHDLNWIWVRYLSVPAIRFHVTFLFLCRDICEQRVFFLPPPTVLSLTPLISGCEILPSISSALNDLLIPSPILSTFLHFLSSSLQQGVHLKSKRSRIHPDRRVIMNLMLATKIAQPVFRVRIHR